MTRAVPPSHPGRWAVVPVKRAARSKTRLGPMLGCLREEFARDLSLNTIEIIRASGLFEVVLVVTSDPLIHASCTAAGVIAHDDQDLPLNGACELGLSLAAAHGCDFASIVHSDLATIDTCTLEGILAQFGAHRARHGHDVIGLVRCKEGSGTNMVLLDPRLPFAPAFGPGSFAAHARQVGARGHELAGGEAAFDIDSPTDLMRLLRVAPALRWTARYASLIRAASTCSMNMTEREIARQDSETIGELALSQHL